MGKKKVLPTPPPRLVTYKRARWKHWARYFAVAVICMLNFSLVMSTIHIYQVHHSLQLARELSSFLLVLFFDLTILLPMVLEVDGVSITPDDLILNRLLGKSKLKWSDIIYFGKPVYLNYAVLRTAHWVYLLNQRDIERFDEVVEIIQRQWAKVAK